MPNGEKIKRTNLFIKQKIILKRIEKQTSSTDEYKKFKNNFTCFRTFVFPFDIKQVSFSESERYVYVRETSGRFKICPK